ncbi:MAG TPA: hypothetical protein VFI11_00540 [Anaerolineales bacterium]|nr:hypothetical protein [Anaerolineales bacterium]
MATAETTTGLACPNCQGRLVVPEGVRIVRCPYCDLRSAIRGERGLLRYQAPRKLDREGALRALRQFQAGLDKAPGLPQRGKVTELFVAYMPVWAVWARVAAWAFGRKKVGSSKNRRLEPREVQILRAMSWNAPACDVQEFGVERVPLDGQNLVAFDPAALHADGMVFEPVGSSVEAIAEAHHTFDEEVRDISDLDEIGSMKIRHLRERLAIVYYPLWVARYTFHGRAYQVVIDGHSGKVLYGKAPGNIWYRAAALVAGMAVGALTAVDGTALALRVALESDDSDSLFLVVLPLVLGLGLMLWAYRRFRYGEQVEFRQRGRRRPKVKSDEITNLLKDVAVEFGLGQRR